MPDLGAPERLVELMEKHITLYKWRVDAEIRNQTSRRVFRIVRKDNQDTISKLEWIHFSENAHAGKGAVNISSVGEVVDQLRRDLLAVQRIDTNHSLVRVEEFHIDRGGGGESWDILIQMEYLPDLMSFLQTSEMTYKTCVQLGIDLCGALAVLNQSEIVHQSIEPNNIFCDKDGRFKLGDTGIARAILSFPGLRPCSPDRSAFCAPECAIGQFNVLSDIYSIGLILYTLANGRCLPFQNASNATEMERNLAIEKRMRKNSFDRPAEMPESFWNVIRTACASSPEKRFFDPEEMKRALKPLLLESYAQRTVPLTVDRGTPDEAVFEESKKSEKIKEHSAASNENGSKPSNYAETDVYWEILRDNVRKHFQLIWAEGRKTGEHRRLSFDDRKEIERLTFERLEAKLIELGGGNLSSEEAYRVLTIHTAECANAQINLCIADKKVRDRGRKRRLLTFLTIAVIMVVVVCVALYDRHNTIRNMDYKLSAGGISQTEVRLSWNLDHRVRSILYAPVGMEGSKLVREHVVGAGTPVISGLLPDTNYHFSIKDAATNVGSTATARTSAAEYLSVSYFSGLYACPRGNESMTTSPDRWTYVSDWTISTRKGSSADQTDIFFLVITFDDPPFSLKSSSFRVAIKRNNLFAFDMAVNVADAQKDAQTLCVTLDPLFDLAYAALGEWNEGDARLIFFVEDELVFDQPIQLMRTEE